MNELMNKCQKLRNISEGNILLWKKKKKDYSSSNKYMRSQCLKVKTVCAAVYLNGAFGAEMFRKIIKASTTKK